MISRRRFLVFLGGAGAMGAWWAGRRGALHAARRTSWALGSDVRVTVLSEDPRAAEGHEDRVSHGSYRALRAAERQEREKAKRGTGAASGEEYLPDFLKE